MSSTPNPATKTSWPPSRAKTRTGFSTPSSSFPEEGKYHYDGHRKCGVLFSPRESSPEPDLCPKCGKKLTIGVMHRVDELADRRARNPAALQGSLQKPHPAQRNHRRIHPEDGRMPERLGHLFPLHPRVRERVLHPERGSHLRTGPAPARQSELRHRSDEEERGENRSRARWLLWSHQPVRGRSGRAGERRPTVTFLAVPLVFSSFRLSSHKKRKPNLVMLSYIKDIGEEKVDTYLSPKPKEAAGQDASGKI